MRGWSKPPPSPWTLGILVAGLFAGLFLVLGMSVSKDESTSHEGAARAVTDNVIHLGEEDVESTCFRDVSDKTKHEPVMVSFEIGVDGKVHSAKASGGPPKLCRCVEARVKAWEFLPQATTRAMTVPFEVDVR